MNHVQVTKELFSKVDPLLGGLAEVAKYFVEHGYRYSKAIWQIEAKQGELKFIEGFDNFSLWLNDDRLERVAIPASVIPIVQQTKIAVEQGAGGRLTPPTVDPKDLTHFAVLVSEVCPEFVDALTNLDYFSAHKNGFKAQHPEGIEVCFVGLNPEHTPEARWVYRKDASSGHANSLGEAFVAWQYNHSHHPNW